MDYQGKFEFLQW